MLPNNMNQPNDLALNLMELGNAFNTNTALTTKRLTAIIMQLDKRLPGFREDYNKQIFTIDIANIAGAVEQARREGGNNALTIIKDNSGVLKQLKKGAKEKDKKWLEEHNVDTDAPPETTWLDAYNNGIKDAEEYGKRLDQEALAEEEETKS